MPGLGLVLVSLPLAMRPFRWLAEPSAALGSKTFCSGDAPECSRRITPSAENAELSAGGSSVHPPLHGVGNSRICVGWSATEGISRGERIQEAAEETSPSGGGRRLLDDRFQPERCGTGRDRPGTIPHPIADS
jgi:hypothetical protein